MPNLTKLNKIEKMKIYLRLILLLITFFVFNCKENKVQQKTEITEEEPVELKKSIEPTQNSITKKEKEIKNKSPKIYDYKYVIARLGLNYRDMPKGKNLGKFPLNTQRSIEQCITSKM